MLKAADTAAQTKGKVSPIDVLGGKPTKGKKPRKGKSVNISSPRSPETHRDEAGGVHGRRGIPPASTCVKSAEPCP